jgi:hypothetical protein
MATRREVWFRNLFRFAPRSVIPVHWKGWLLIILGPVALVTVGNVLSGEPMLAASLFIAGFVAVMVAIYSHTTWDRS